MRNVSVEDVGSSREIPILGTAAGAHVRGARIITKRITGMIRCPPHLAAFTGIYAMYVEGDSMSPQFASGDLIVVNPNKPARPGDVVVVRMRAEGDSEEATLGIYVGRENGDIMISKRRPPDSHVKLSGAHVVSVERVLTLAEILGA